MITVLKNGLGQAWIPVKPATTVYVGSIVGLDLNALTDFGCTTWDQADGANNTTNKDVPYGVVIGTNAKAPSYSSTYLCEYITAGSATSSRTETNIEKFVGVEGPYSKGQHIAMVKVDLIGPNTVLRAPIYNNAVGTAPSVLTTTAADSTGDTATTNSCDFTPVASLCTIYCRSGAAAGQYAITNDTSKTAATWNDYDFRGGVAVGDTMIRVPLRPWGLSYVRFGDDTVCSYINCSETPASNYTVIHVTKLNLEVAGGEYAEFWIDADNFCTVRS